jgi:hypothetical protein
MDEKNFIDSVYPNNRKEIILTREQLYRKVWSTPTTKLAKEFRISDVALAKLCKKHNIQKPPIGYWQKIKLGKIVHPIPPPEISKEVQVAIIIDPN